MKHIAPAVLALMLGACAHECNCAAPVQAESVETMELEIAEPEVETVVEEAAPLVEEEEVIVEIQTAPPAPATITSEGSPARRVVTRRLVEEHDGGTPTAPAIGGSAADDPLLSETPRVLEDTTFESSDALEATIEGEAEDARE